MPLHSQRWWSEGAWRSSSPDRFRQRFASDHKHPLAIQPVIRPARRHFQRSRRSTLGWSSSRGFQFTGNYPESNDGGPCPSKSGETITVQSPQKSTPNRFACIDDRCTCRRDKALCPVDPQLNKNAGNRQTQRHCGPAPGESRSRLPASASISGRGLRRPATE